MNATIVSFVKEVEGAIASGDAGRRAVTLRRVTDLFSQQSAQLGETQVSIFDEVMHRLCRDLEFKARIELSDKLADIGNAPRKVVRDLALDRSIEVARPILERSARLSEDDLVAVAEQRGEDHLMALTKRPVLTERVTDILVDRGSEIVVRSVARNEGARFSEGGYGQLLTKARGDIELQRSLQARVDIPKSRMAELVAIAREKVKTTLVAELGDDADAAVEAAVDQVGGALSKEGQSKALVNDFEEALLRVGRETRELDEAKILAWLRAGKLEDALAGIAQLAGAPVEMVAKAYYAPSFDPLLFVVRGARLGWGTFKQLLIQKAGRMPPLDVMRSAFESYQQLSVATAQRVVRFTAARDYAQKPDAA